MRRHARYFYVLFFIIIITFIFWGVGTNDKEGARFVAEIGDERITKDEFWRIYERARESYREMYKGQPLEEIEQKLNLKLMVLDSLVEDKVLLVSARELGLVASDDELQHAIIKDPRFIREGSFKKEIYLRTLANNRLTPDYYESILRNQLSTNRMRNLIISGVDVTDADLAGIKVDAARAELIKQAALFSKRNAALKSYIEGAKVRMKVKINMDVIS
jgi:peptidyl-prolyl cis-trans isomerase D